MNNPAQRISNREIFTFMIGTIIATIFASVPVVIVGEHLSEELGIEADVLMTSHPTLILLSLCTIQLAFCAVLANYLYHLKESIKTAFHCKKSRFPRRCGYCSCWVPSVYPPQALYS